MGVVEARVRRAREDLGVQEGRDEQVTVRHHAVDPAAPQGRGELTRRRSPRIKADAAHAVLTRDPRECTGRFFIDDEVLAEEGVTDLSGYGGEDLVTDLFLDG